MILQTERLLLREMTQEDFPALCRILQDEQTMYAYEGAFSDSEAQVWLDRQLERYRQLGFGLWAVILKQTGEMIGQCGLTMQPWKGQELLEIGYLFNRSYWHCGYATEAAQACRQYAFETLGADEVCSIIRDTNTASQQVALRNGMHKADRMVKHYRGVDMPHDRYVVSRTSLSEKHHNRIKKTAPAGPSTARAVFFWDHIRGKGRCPQKPQGTLRPPQKGEYELFAGICFIKISNIYLSYPYTNPPHPFCQAIL